MQTTGKRAASFGAALLWMIAAGGSTLAATPAAAPAAAAPPTILIDEFMFRPTALTVKAGATVTWTNQDQEPHTVRSDTGLFASAALDTDESFSFRFDKPGTYHFICSIHPRMTGTVVVE